MGEDIHNKIYLYSKVEKKYIDALQLHEHSPFDFEDMFPPIFSDRCYDVFKILCGSIRSDMMELKCGTDGIPKFLEGTTFKKYLDIIGNDFYMFKYYKFNELRRGLKEYVKWMNDPVLYYEQMEDSEDDIDLLKNNEDYLKEVKEDFEGISYVLNEIVENIDIYLGYRKTKDEDLNGKLKDIIDFNKSIVLFWLSC